MLLFLNNYAGVDWAAPLKFSVAPDDKVIADVGPALRLVPLADVLEPDVHRRSRCAAVNGYPVGAFACVGHVNNPTQ